MSVQQFVTKNNFLNFQKQFVHFGHENPGSGSGSESALRLMGIRNTEIYSRKKPSLNTGINKQAKNRIKGNNLQSLLTSDVKILINSF